MKIALLPLLLLCLGSLPALAQSDALTSVQTRADNWHNVVLQEKLFVHTDKSFYLAGEILWCKLYCVEGDTHRPLDISKLAYVEIIDRDGKPVLQGKIALEKGLGEGSFYLTPSAASGNYRLRAYTNWMKNFGPETFFEQPLTIINTIKGVDTATIKDTSTNTPGEAVANPYSLSFYPEGGDLVTGLPSTVAFEAIDDQLQGINARGLILSGNGDTVSSFTTLREGMGTFQLTPGPGQTYKALLYCPDGITRSWPMPSVLPQGYTLHLNDAPGGTLTLAVHASPGLSPQNTRLFVHSGSSSAFTGQIPESTGDSALFIIPRSRLQEGNTRFTIFDASGRPRAERLFFILPRNWLNITATTDRPEYGLRQKVQLTIATKTREDEDLPANLSVAVYRLDSLQGYPKTDILSYLWMSSELTGRPLAYTKDTIDTDLWSLTHGWTRFRWTDVLNHPSGPRIFPPEIRGQLITGRLSDPHTGASAREITTWLSTPGYTFQFATTQTDSGGRFQFDIKDFYGQDGIVIHTLTEGYNYKVDAFSPFSEQYTKPPLPAFHLTGWQFHPLTRHSIGMQVQNVFTGDSLKHFALPRIDTMPFYGRPDYTYLLDDYTRFTSIEEVLREYVREINVTRPHGHLHVVMLNEPAHDVFRDGKTLVLLDGVPVPNDRIFTYDALKVKRLDVMPREYILGPSHFSGIASFTTYKGDYEGLELDSASLQLEYEGLQWRRQFYSPAYTTIRQTQSRLPDFRNVLYWSPNIQTGTKNQPVEFYTSDLPGDYLIVVQGLSPDGRAGVTYRRFTVHHPIP
jgi:hypothetical protein